jgi:hypothetical protein
MLFLPFRCFDARQLLPRISVARCRATCWIAVYDSEFWLALPYHNSYPSAKVLSPNTSMHSELSALDSLISSHIPTTIPRNSQRLLDRESP